MKVRKWLIIWFLMVGMTGIGEAFAQSTYRERQLKKLYLQKTQRPTVEEKAAQQKKWAKLRAQYESEKRLEQQKRTQARLRYGKEVASQQAHPDPLNPLKQQGRLGRVLQRSSVLTQDAVEREKVREFYAKKRYRYKSRDRLRPHAPIYKFPLGQR